jgi:hypothetical protein
MMQAVTGTGNDNVHISECREGDNQKRETLAEFELTVPTYQMVKTPESRRGAAVGHGGLRYDFRSSFCITLR